MQKAVQSADASVPSIYNAMWDDAVSHIIYTCKSNFFAP